MFTIEMFPAGHGDCLWIEYGDKQNPHRILIDGGTGPTYELLKERIESLPDDEKEFELFIVTHVDADHIEGSVRLLGSLDTLGVSFKEVWFNGWRHLPDDPEDDHLGPLQGEFLSTLIGRQGMKWNKSFAGNAIFVPAQGALPKIRLEGGMTLTLISPTHKQLENLRKTWKKEIEKIGLDRDNEAEVLERLQKSRLKIEDDVLGEDDNLIDVKELAESASSLDGSEPNGSSIAVLAEYQGKKCLLTGDAFAPVVQSAVERLLEDEEEGTKLKVNLCKLAHHGSRRNVTTGMLKLLDCKHYLFSTNGDKFKHPDREGVARVIQSAGKNASLYFNYKTKFNDMWDDEKLTAKHKYKTIYPDDGAQGLVVDVMTLD
jgi:beta-lactamase superfamily II metal-dependent hydrolase